MSICEAQMLRASMQRTSWFFRPVAQQARRLTPSSCFTSSLAGAPWRPPSWRQRRFASRGLGTFKSTVSSFDLSAGFTTSVRNGIHGTATLSSASSGDATFRFGASDACATQSQKQEAWKCAGFGEVVMDLALEGGGILQVLAHDAAQNDAFPTWAPPGSVLQWRVLRFRPAEGVTDLIQSVSKVCIAPPGSVPPFMRTHGEILALTYTQSLATVVLGALSIVGAPVVREQLDAQTSVDDFSEELRILCIGLGGGSVPAFLTQALPHCIVDVAELEPGVIRAATEEMGLVTCARLSVTACDGAEFALSAANSAVTSSRQDLAYDAVIVDAYDAAGNVPSELWSRNGGLAVALANGLLKRRGGVVVTNFLPHVDTGPPLDVYREALAGRDAGPGFTVQSFATDGGEVGNFMAVQTCGGPTNLASMSPLAVAECLREAARRLQPHITCNFDMEAIVARNFRLAPSVRANDNKIIR
eukprot:TRINITY_DN20567_c0_g1_i3.p1 TRINITY_DN20567_c0_g1~~TRINITY_DN20567_c0_g1_i3.p1  ORF type:complete len:473 (-),score=52.40 TRINITY_DN20567_c0_g1_i3:11-1429(-)